MASAASLNALHSASAWFMTLVWREMPAGRAAAGIDGFGKGPVQGGCRHGGLAGAAHQSWRCFPGWQHWHWRAGILGRQASNACVFAVKLRDLLLKGMTHRSAQEKACPLARTPAAI